MSLSQLGWRQFFQQQLSLDELEQTIIGRVTDHHRNGFLVITQQGKIKLPISNRMPQLTVGDWILMSQENRFERLLERYSVFRRKAAGTQQAEQLIASNVDTVFIVSSLNEDFNLSRIERYLMLVKESGAEAVIVLTKADSCELPAEYVDQVRKLDPMLIVEAVNSLDWTSVEALLSWCKPGKTIAMLGSSGVGKSTLINTLLSESAQQTGGIREDDGKGRHTTTARSLHIMPTGCLLMDTPGMRELQLVDCEQGLSHTFSDITALVNRCRFSDCQHESEPGCAIQLALATGELDLRRLNNYFKLKREQARNRETLAERKAKDKDLSKLYRSVQAEAYKRKKG
ncbi:ribosome small subunit-dependent GTPase A [Aliikangiella coralliicola]|uniref:Small ribosomal subunit biogenesis GTPase RsgA n=1 Tax=Aliikangiella coralliicola TaxID=2592383 RepID=A0A545UK78_9GAMM|nr:ribosome small subunit-dependent GTPase A [Aliikangiella coralliicola]